MTLQDLEKRVSKLETELKAFREMEDDRHSSVKTHSRKQHTKKHSKKHSKTHSKKHSKTHSKPHNKTKKKRKVNEYFKMMLEAKKTNKPSFVYNDNTYNGTKHDRLGMIYKKELDLD